MAKRFAGNVPGPFYVADGECMSCRAPEHCAPKLMGYRMSRDGKTGHGFFKRQPERPEETRQAIDAARAACCNALRYSGTSPAILQELDPSICAPLHQEPEA